MPQVGSVNVATLCGLIALATAATLALWNIAERLCEIRNQLRQARDDLESFRADLFARLPPPRPHEWRTVPSGPYPSAAWYQPNKVDP